MLYVCAFCTMRSLSLFFIGAFVIDILYAWVILALCHCHICICMDVFVYVIQSNFWFYFTLIIFYVSPRCMGCSTNSSSSYIHFFHMFVNVISVFPAMCWCNVYNIILGCTPSWKYFRYSFLFMVFNEIVVVLVDLHAK